MARCKVVSCSGPVNPAVAARVLQAAERALDELRWDEPLVAQLVTEAEIDALWTRPRGAPADLTPAGWTDRHAIFLRADTPGWSDQVVVAPGEVAAVFNRHQLPVLNARLADLGGLPGLFKQVNKPHHMAGGGLVKHFAYGGVTAPVAHLISKLDAMGFHHGSTTGGGHAPGGFHPRGMAVDYGDAANDMGRLWSVVYPRRRDFAELFGPSRLKKPTLMHYGRGFSDPGLQADHEDHIHMAIASALKGALGSGGSLGQAVKLAAVKLQGPAGPLRDIGQKALDEVRKGAQKKLDSAAADAGGDLGGFSGGGSSSANLSLGRRMAARMGWTGGEWAALKELWNRESGWSNTARNPSSGAFGIPQALPPGKMGAAAAGGDAAAQIRWGLQYIKGRYGTPSGALAFHNSHNWYAGGGIVGHLSELAEGGLTGGDGGSILDGLPHAAKGLSLRKRGKGKGKRLSRKRRRRPKKIMFLPRLQGKPGIATALDPADAGEPVDPILQRYDVALALAELTPQITDDLAALRGLEGRRSYLLAHATAPTDVIEQAQSLKSVRDQIAGLTGSSTSDSERASVLSDQLAAVTRSLRVSQAQFSVFRGFAPLMAGFARGGLPRFAHGGPVLSTGLAEVHRGEHIIPDARGAYGSQLATGGPAKVELTLNVRSDAGQVVEIVDARIDGKLHRYNQQTVRRTRQIATAPGR